MAKNTVPFGYFASAPEDLNKRPPKLVVNGVPVTERPTVEELVAYFDQATLPTGPVRLDAGSEIVNARRFVYWSLACVASSGSRQLRAAFYYRLLAFKTILDGLRKS